MLSLAIRKTKTLYHELGIINIKQGHFGSILKQEVRNFEQEVSFE